MLSNSIRTSSIIKCRLLLILAATLLSLWLAACNTSSSSPTPTTAESGTSFELDTALAGLAKFKSIYTEFDLEWDGSENGAPTSGSLHLEQIQIREIEVQEIYATITEVDSDWVVAAVQTSQESWFYHQGEAANWRSADQQSVSELINQSLLTPQVFFDLFELRVDSPSGSKQVENVTANVYSLSAADFSSESISFNQAQGTATVSAEGGYLIELDFSAEVEFSESGLLMDTGEIQISFRVPDRSSSLTVQSPIRARQDIPLPVDVTLPDPTPIPLSQRDQFTPPTDNQLSLETKIDALSVAEMYHAQMGDYGWTALMFNLPLEATAEIDPIPLRFVREDEGVAIKITADEGISEVELLFGERGTIEGNLCNAHTDCDSLTWFNFPLAPDGDVKVIMSGGGFGRLVYLTSCKSEFMRQFYTLVLPAEGWTQFETAETSSNSIYFERGTEAAELIFTPLDDGMTSVEIQSSSPTLDIWGYPSKVDLELIQEFPQSTDAQLFRLMPGQLAYRSQQSVNQLVELYQSELSTAGWTAQVDPVTDNQTTMLRYHKDETTATVLVKAADGEGSVVWVTLYRKKAGEP